MTFVALPNAVVASFAGERVGQLAPRRVCKDTIAHAATVGRVGVLAIKSCDADFDAGDKLRVEKLGDVGNAFHAVCRVGQSDQAVGFAAAVAGVEAEDGGGGAALAGQAGQNIAEQVLEALGGVGVGEEAVGLLVVIGGDAADDLGQVGGEISVGDCALEDVFAWLTCVKNCWQAHSFSDRK